MNVGSWLGNLFGRGDGAHDPSKGRGKPRDTRARKRRRKSVRRGPEHVKGGWRAARTPWLVNLRQSPEWRAMLRARLLEIKQRKEARNG